MNEKYLEDGKTFTDEYKLLIGKHSVINHIFTHLIEVKDDHLVENHYENYTLGNLYNDFKDNIIEASKKFYELGTDAFNEVDKIQDGLYLATSILYQFNPTLKNYYEISDTYERINYSFWGNYFYLNGIDGARKIKKFDELSINLVAKMFAEEFWKNELDFPETIKFGYLKIIDNIEENSSKG